MCAMLEERQPCWGLCTWQTLTLAPWVMFTAVGETDKRPAGSCALDVPSVSKLFPMIPPASWLVHLAARPVCLASVHITQATVVSSRHAHLDLHQLFLLGEAHTHTLLHFKRAHLARQTFHTNKRALWTWRHTASSSAGKSIWTSSRPSAPPWPRLKPTLSTCCQMPLSKSKRMGKRACGRRCQSLDSSGFHLWWWSTICCKTESCVQLYHSHNTASVFTDHLVWTHCKDSSYVK